MKIQVMLLFWEALHLYFVVYKYTHPPPPVELKKDLCEASDSILFSHPQCCVHPACNTLLICLLFTLNMCAWNTSVRRNFY